MHFLVLYNPYSKKGQGLQGAKKLQEIYPNDSFSFDDMTAVEDPVSYLESIDPETRIVFTGGDGTLNILINKLYDKNVKRDLFYFPAGSGNDFINDIGKEKGKEPFLLNPYMEKLPKVTVNGKETYFVNGVGYGLDGYCCEEADRLKSIGKNRSYTMIAFLGLISKYKPCGGTVTVDGKKTRYEKIWMAPTMFGSYFGGGVHIAPEQRRGNGEHVVTQVAIHDVGRLKTLFLFLDVVNGKGAKHGKYIEYVKGHEIQVEFDRPTALQIDGETVLSVKSYQVQFS